MAMLVSNKENRWCQTTNGFSLVGFAVLCTLCLCFFPLFALAGDDFSNQFKQPGFTQYRNKEIATMSNQDLIEHARRGREMTVSREQIELNRQWAESTAEDDFIHGGKAFSKLLQRSLKTYWQEKRQENFGGDSRVPDIYGRGKVSNSLDYDIKLKSDEFNIGLSYEF